MSKAEFPPAPNDDELDKLAQVSEEALLPEKHDPEKPISGNIRCVFCGYNLYTIPRGGICPECGKPAAGSLHGDAYAYANPKYVRLLSWGANMIAWLPAGWFAIFLLTMLAIGSSRASSVCMTVAWAVMMGVLFAVGMWLLTIRENREIAEGESRGDLWRWIARIGGIAHGLTQLAWLIVPLLLGLGARSSVSDSIYLIIWIVGNAISLCAVAPWMSRVAKRTYQKGLPAAMFVACIAPGGVLLLLTVWIAANSFLRNTIFADIIKMLGCFGTCGWFALAFTCLPLFVWAWYRLATSLGRAAMLARVHEKFPDARVKL